MSFRITNIIESGLSDCHKLISFFIKSYISRLKPKTKNFEAEKIVKDVRIADFLSLAAIQTITIWYNLMLFSF